MNIRNTLIIIMMLGCAACSNADWEFPDYDVQGCYFPYQTPARTLILGNYDQGFNENDNNGRFEITALLTGIYENDIERKVYFEIDNSLLEYVANVKPLPADYYTIEALSPVIIPTGDNKATISVQLNDKFFDDELSFGEVQTTNYVIPISMTQVENIDSIYYGIPYSGISNLDRTNTDHWAAAPKDYTLFGIKFMNRFHGKYLRRGLDKVTSGTPYIGREYHSEYIVDDEVIFVQTCGRNKVHLSNIVGLGDKEIPEGTSKPVDVALELDFAEDNTCTITSYKDDQYNVTGTGKWVEGGDTFGGKTRDVIYLSYTYTDNVFNETHAVKDTIVMRDRAAVFEEFKLTYKGEE